MGLRIDLLGPLRVTHDVPIRLERTSSRRLLSILALDAPHRIGTDVLIDRFWGEAPPATARAALQTHISALRKLLSASVIVTEGYGYRLELAGCDLDVEEFTHHATRAREAGGGQAWERALEEAEAAVALWRGTPYVELADDEFAKPEIARLDELRLGLLELRAEALLGLGREAEALPDLEQLVVEQPLRERLWEHLMTARYRLGRHAEALEAYRRAWSAFGEIGLEPSGALRRLEQKILLHEGVLSASARTNLPVELTAFVGRKRELAEVTELLSERRLVTLTGVGGSGKTRLATKVGRLVLESFPDGCWLAELAPLRDPALVATQVAGAIGLKPRGDVVGALVTAIAVDTSLFVLDNCEHVVSGAAQVARAILESAPEVKVLATSREPLRVPGEVVYEVPPMAFPKEGDDGAPATFDAVRLFKERASHAQPSFTIDLRNAASVGKICRRLDGIPLAIELAASHVGSLGAETIAERLDDRFRILVRGSPTGPERHQTLEAALAWSYDLLEEREQLLFARLSVFRGGFMLEMAEDVCSGVGIDRSEVVALVAALVEKSLVVSYEVGSRPRYRLLETVREYAVARLAEIDDPTTVRDRHLRWSVGFTWDVAARLYSAGRAQLFERLTTESDNLEEALQHAEEVHSGDDVEVLSGALGVHWLWLGYLSLAIPALERALERPATVEAEAAIREQLSAAHFQVGDGAAAYREAKRAYELVAGLEPSVVRVSVTTRLVHMQWALVDHDPARGIPLAEEALATAQALDESFSKIRALDALGQALSWSGRVEDGLERSRAAFDLALHYRDPVAVITTYEHLTTALFLDPVARRSEPARVAAVMLTNVPRDDRALDASGWLGWVLLQSGDWNRAEGLFDEVGRRHLEGFERNGHLIVRAALRWMQGRIDQASHDLAELHAVGVNRRWYHDYLPLAADVAADDDRLSAVRDAAETYLALEVDASEEAMKIAVLSPLARAEVDAALETVGAERADHVARARTSVTRAREILRAFPPPALGSVQMETPATRLALAEAELSRVAQPSPEPWEKVYERADYLYFRLYSQFRLAEALVQVERAAEGEEQLRAAHVRASSVGADGLRRRIEAFATSAGIPLDVAAGMPPYVVQAGASTRARNASSNTPSGS
jgi:predicted ATPase/DNA-binding SARP family transcriptional activator